MRPNGQHRLALLEMVDTLRLGHLLTARNERNDCVPEPSYPAGDATNAPPGGMNNRQWSNPEPTQRSRALSGYYATDTH